MIACHRIVLGTSERGAGLEQDIRPDPPAVADSRPPGIRLPGALFKAAGVEALGAGQREDAEGIGLQWKRIAPGCWTGRKAMKLIALHMADMTGKPRISATGGNSKLVMQKARNRPSGIRGARWVSS